MNIFITGATGFIGKQLVCKYLKEGHKVTILTHVANPFIYYKPLNIQNLKFVYEVLSLPVNTTEKTKFDLVINLAGSPINVRWTKNRKNKIYASRIRTTAALVHYFKTVNHKPDLFISTSAIGYYAYNCDFNNPCVYDEKTSLDRIVNRDKSFAHDLCRDWEDIALQAKNYKVRTIIYRFGVVLGREGGFVKQMHNIFKFGFYFILGHGEQCISWIHISDLMNSFDFTCNNKSMQGIYNLTTPMPTTNAKINQTIANKLNKSKYFKFRASWLRCIFGDMANELLLCGVKVLPNRLLNDGYKFKYPDLDSAMNNIFRK